MFTLYHIFYFLSNFFEFLFYMFYSLDYGGYMCRKSPAVAYISKKIKLSARSEFVDEIMDSPLSMKDINFMMDILSGMSYFELAEKYQKSKARISQWKRTCFETLHRYELAKLD